MAQAKSVQAVEAAVEAPVVEAPVAAAPDMATIMAAVVQVLSKLGTTVENQTLTLEAINKANVKRIEDAITPEYLADPRNKIQRLIRPAYQNGKTVEPIGLSDETVQKLSELRTASYMGGFVRVVADDPDGPQWLFYPSVTPDDRIAQMRLFISFPDLVNKLHAEMLIRLETPAEKVMRPLREELA